jgi:hypothetical protein
MAEVARETGLNESRHAYRMARVGIQNSEYSRTYGLRVAANDADAEAGGRRAFADSLTPDRMRGFVTSLPELGVQNEGTGQARLAAARAGGDVDVVRRAKVAQDAVVAERQREVAAADVNAENAWEKYSNANARLVGAQGLPDNSRKSAAKKAAAVAEAASNALAMGDNLTAARADASQKREQLERAITDQMERQKALGMAIANQDQANLGVKKNQLELLRQQEQAARGTAFQGGMMDPGQREFALSSLRYIDRHGIEKASPLQREAAFAVPGAQEWVTRRAENAGLGFAEEVGGIIGKDLNFNRLKGKADPLEGDVIAEEARIAAALAENTKTVWENAGKVLEKEIRQGVKVMLDQLLLEQGQRDAKRQIGAAQGVVK